MCCYEGLHFCISCIHLSWPYGFANFIFKTRHLKNRRGKKKKRGGRVQNVYIKLFDKGKGIQPFLSPWNKASIVKFLKFWDRWPVVPREEVNKSCSSGRPCQDYGLGIPLQTPSLNWSRADDTVTIKGIALALLFGLP